MIFYNNHNLTIMINNKHQTIYKNKEFKLCRI